MVGSANAFYGAVAVVVAGTITRAAVGLLALPPRTLSTSDCFGRTVAEDRPEPARLVEHAG